MNSRGFVHRWAAILSRTHTRNEAISPKCPSVSLGDRGGPGVGLSSAWGPIPVLGLQCYQAAFSAATPHVLPVPPALCSGQACSLGALAH